MSYGQSKSLSLLRSTLLLIWVVDSVSRSSLRAASFLVVGKFSTTEWYAQFLNLLGWCLFSVFLNAFLFFCFLLC